MALQALPPATVRLIKSTQVITTPASIVKELVENSIDAGAKVIAVKLDNHGFSHLEVRDNGCGISEPDVEFIAKPHYTSKISSFSDLASLTSYGFRGEAVASLCAVADLTVTTKTSSSTMAYCYSYDHDGNVTKKKPTAAPNGTTVVVESLYKNIPVRQQYYKSSKRRKEELKKVEDVVLALSMASPGVHFTLSHEKISLIQRSSCQGINGAFMNMYPALFKLMVHKVKTSEEMKFEVYLPGTCSDAQLSRSSPDRLFILVNQRPISHKAIEKMVKAHYSQKYEGCHGRYPVGVLALTLPPHCLDVNLEPNKTRVHIQDEDVILETIRGILADIYGPINTCKPGESKAAAGEDAEVTCTFSGFSQSQETKSNRVKQGVHCGLSGEAASLSSTTEKEQQREGNSAKSSTSKFKFRSLSKMGKNPASSFPDQSSAAADTTCAGMVNSRNSDNSDSSNNKKKCSSTLNNSKERTANTEPVSNKENISVPVNSEENSSVKALPVSRRANESWEALQSNLRTSTQNSRPEEGFPSLPHSSVSPHRSNDTVDSDLSFSFCKLPSPASQSIVPYPPSPEKPHQDHSAKRHAPLSDVPDNENSGIKDLQHRNQLHESIIGEDGVPVYKIPPLPCTEEDADDDLDAVTFDRDTGAPGVDKLSNKVNHVSRKEEAGNIEEAVQESKTEPNMEVTEQIDKEGAEAWSRGHIVAGGANIQTVKVLSSAEGSGGRQSSGTGAVKRSSPAVRSAEAENAPKKSKISCLGPADQDYVHGRLVKKPASPFILFSRDIRSQVLSEHPGADFALVAKEMAARWKALDPETRKFYTDMSKQETKKYNQEIQRLQQNRGNKSLNLSFMAQMTRGSLDKYVAPTTPQATRERASRAQLQPLVAKTPWKHRSTQVTVSLEALRRGRQQHGDPVPGTRLVGSVGQGDAWVCVRDGAVQAINVYRAQEMLLVHRLLTSYQFTVKQLQVSVPFNASTLGASNWTRLLSLSRELVPDSNFYYVTDQRVTLNGFEISLFPGESSNVDISHGEVTGLTDVVSFYGLYDLKELLATLSACPATSLRLSRPLKLHHWIKGEAVRMVRSISKLVQREKVEEILEQWQRDVVGAGQQCIHNKPIFTQLFSLTDLPPSQSLLEESAAE